MTRHFKDFSPQVSVTLSEHQLYTLLRALSELELVRAHQYEHLTPSQKREVKISLRHLEKFKCWQVLETALAEAQGGLA